jgi:hypothetical protein
MKLWDGWHCRRALRTGGDVEGELVLAEADLHQVEEVAAEEVAVDMARTEADFHLEVTEVAVI